MWSAEMALAITQPAHYCSLLSEGDHIHNQMKGSGGHVLLIKSALITNGRPIVQRNK